MPALPPCVRHPRPRSMRLYNNLVQRCFNDCVDDFRSKHLTDGEEKVRQRPALATCGAQRVQMTRPLQRSARPSAPLTHCRAPACLRAPPRTVRLPLLREVPQPERPHGAALPGAVFRNGGQGRGGSGGGCKRRQAVVAARAAAAGNLCFASRSRPLLWLDSNRVSLPPKRL